MQAIRELEPSEIEAVTGGEAIVIGVILSVAERMDSAPKTTDNTLDMGSK